MDTYSIMMYPLSLAEFRKLRYTTIEADQKIPADSKSRRYTDKMGFLFYGCALTCCLLGLIPFITQKSDIRRIFYDTDRCGNFCGIKNEKIAGVECSGKDYRTKPYSDLKECVTLCPWGVIVGSYTCSQKVINSFSAEMTRLYLKELEEMEEKGQISQDWQHERQEEREEWQTQQEKEQPTVDSGKNDVHFDKNPIDDGILEAVEKMKQRMRELGILLEKEQPTVDLGKHDVHFDKNPLDDGILEDIEKMKQENEQPTVDLGKNDFHFDKNPTDDGILKDIEKMKQRINELGILPQPLRRKREETQQGKNQNSINDTATEKKLAKIVQMRYEGINLTLSPSVDEDSQRYIDIEDDEIIYDTDPSQYFRRSWWKFIVVAVIAVVLTLLFFIMAKTGLAIWSGMVLTFFLIALSTYISWRLFFESAVLEGRSKGRIIIPISATVFSVFCLVTVWVRRKQLGLLQSIFKEAAKVILFMPDFLVFIEMVAIVQLAVLVLFILGAVQIMTTTQLKRVAVDEYEFGELSLFAKFLLILLAFVANWSMQIFAGFQWMAVAETVAYCYFEENGQRKGSIFKNISRTFYHFGTITYGSLFQPWVSTLNHLLKFFTCSCGYGVCFFERIQKAQICLETYSKNAFIETALHGQSFSRSGKRAYNVLLTNAPGAIAMNNLGSAIVLINEINVVVIATATSYVLFLDSFNIWLPIAASCIANTVVVNGLFGMFQIAMHTLSICFCEDKVINGNVPYHASEELKQFIEKAEELYAKGQSVDVEQTR